jgi:hypothetical protein
MSGEHVISRGVLEAIRRVMPADEPVLSDGPGGTLSLSIENFRVNRLCEAHNRRLSPTDAEAVRLTEALLRVTDAHYVDKALRDPRCIERSNINGVLLEQWMLKTFISLCFARDSTYEEPGIVTVAPPPGLVNAIFNGPVPAEHGLMICTDPIPTPTSAFLHPRAKQVARHDPHPQLAGVKVQTLFMPTYMTLILGPTCLAIGANITGLPDEVWREAMQALRQQGDVARGYIRPPLIAFEWMQADVGVVVAPTPRPFDFVDLSATRAPSARAPTPPTQAVPAAALISTLQINWTPDTASCAPPLSIAANAFVKWRPPPRASKRRRKKKR